ncbi:MAG: hypothetical protein ACF8SC_01840 [Phycisphaerales bacterium JB037]
MQDLKADTVLFLTREDSPNPDRNRAAAKKFAACAVDQRHVENTDAADHDGPAVDVLIHAPSRVIDELKSSDDAGRIENALRRASDHPIRFLQWVETAEPDTARPGTGVGDGSGSQGSVSRANSGLPPQHHRDSQGHGSSQSPAQPGDRQINPPPNPRR